MENSTFIAHGNAKGGGAAPSILQRPLERQIVKLAVTNLYGCTVVIVTSRTGSWISHFWQNPSFEDDSGELNQAVFNKDVLETLDKGCAFVEADNGYVSGLRCQTGAGGWFTSEREPEIVIITPRIFSRKAKLGTRQFPKQVDQIMEALEDILPYAPEPKVVGKSI